MVYLKYIQSPPPRPPPAFPPLTSNPGSTLVHQSPAGATGVDQILFWKKYFNTTSINSFIIITPDIRAWLHNIAPCGYWLWPMWAWHSQGTHPYVIWLLSYFQAFDHRCWKLLKFVNLKPHHWWGVTGFCNARKFLPAFCLDQIVLCMSESNKQPRVLSCGSSEYWWCTSCTGPLSELRFPR